MKIWREFALGFFVCLSLLLLMGQQSAVFPHPVKPTDGVNSITVKAASTAAAAADTAQVIALTPNGGNPCQNPSTSIVGISGASSGTALVQLVALSGTTKIYVCSAILTTVSGTSPTYSLKYGTGTACATGTTTLVGQSAASAAGAVFFYPDNPFITAAGTALCYQMGGTTPVYNYAITYVQQ